jgi:hypothetical protein
MISAHRPFTTQGRRLHRRIRPPAHSWAPVGRTSTLVRRIKEESMKRRIVNLAIAAAALAAAANAVAADRLVQFNRGIGVDPVAGIAGNGLPIRNDVKEVPPGARPWVIRKLRASVDVDGTISVNGAGLLFSGGDAIGTRGAIEAVKATLFCGGVSYDSPQGALDPAGNFRIRGSLGPLPNPCTSPILLIRSLGGSWFAAGIPSSDDDD